MKTKEKILQEKKTKKRWVFLAVSIVRALHDTVISQRSSLKYGQQQQQKKKENTFQIYTVTYKQTPVKATIYTYVCM